MVIEDWLDVFDSRPAWAKPTPGLPDGLSPAMIDFVKSRCDRLGVTLYESSQVAVLAHTTQLCNELSGWGIRYTVVVDGVNIGVLR